MIWVAIEDADTNEMTEFVPATEEQVLYLMDAHKADTRNAMRFCRQVVEGGSRVVYKGITYKGMFGYNILAAKNYVEVYSGLYCGHYDYDDIA